MILPKMALIALCLVGASAVLTGCSSCTGDPRVDGYMCGQAGMNGGVYNQRVTQRQQTLENSQDQKVQQQRQLDDLNAQQQSQQQDIDKVTAELSSLDQDLNKLKAKINAAKTNKSVNQAKLSALQRDTDQVKTQTSLAKADTISSDADRQQELQRLQKKYADLQQELLLVTGGT